MPCTPGYYCASDGLDAETGLCDPGWYCESGSFLAQPTSPEGGKCVAGTYCPQGSYAPTGCDPGSYCATDMLSTVTGPCSAGYYCTGNSTTAQPTGTGGLNLSNIILIFLDRLRVFFAPGLNDKGHITSVSSCVCLLPLTFDLHKVRL